MRGHNRASPSLSRLAFTRWLAIWILVQRLHNMEFEIANTGEFEIGFVFSGFVPTLKKMIVGFCWEEQVGCETPFARGSVGGGAGANGSKRQSADGQRGKGRSQSRQGKPRPEPGLCESKKMETAHHLYVNH